MNATKHVPPRSGVTANPFIWLALALILLGSVVQISFAKSDKSGTETQVVGPGFAAKQAAEIHLRRFLTDDVENMEKAYADRITLVPGHEFLKPDYGLAPRGERDEAAAVDRAKLMAVAKKNPKNFSKEVIGKLLGALVIGVLETKAGDFATDPADPVKTPDGKLHFQMQAGDELVKVGPKGKGDFLLFQFRKIKGQWKIVAEYLD